jgi:hypothetical protein
MPFVMKTTEKIAKLEGMVKQSEREVSRQNRILKIRENVLQNMKLMEEVAHNSDPLQPRNANTWTMGELGDLRNFGTYWCHYENLEEAAKLNPRFKRQMDAFLTLPPIYKKLYNLSYYANHADYRKCDDFSAALNAAVSLISDILNLINKRNLESEHVAHEVMEGTYRKDVLGPAYADYDKAEKKDWEKTGGVFRAAAWH